MKKFYQSIIAMLLIGFCNFGLYAEIACKSTLELTLDNVSGTVNITPMDIIVGNIPSGSEIDRTAFTCADIGDPIQVTASATENGVSIACFSLVTILDETPPVAISDLDVEIVFHQGFSSIVLNPQVIDDGSYDKCGEVKLSVSPSEIYCEDIGTEIEVILSVEDESGNINSAMTNLFVSGFISPIIACHSDFELTLFDEFFVSVDLIHKDNGTCFSKSLQIFDDLENPLSGNLINQNQIGKTVKAVLTRAVDNVTCETLITVIESDCVEFYVCDTKCNDAPLGNCDSGHTTDDYVEWPCDLTIGENYPGFNGTTPEMLQSNYNILAINAEPAVKVKECHSTAMNFTDQIFYIEDQVKILRNWTILEWKTLRVAEYVQTIVFSSEESGLVWNICDTKPNGSPEGECGSGHSLSDDIEWPDDVVSIDARISPDQLQHVSQNDFEDTRPILTNNINKYELSYFDQLVQENTDYSLVSRNWVVSSTVSSDKSAEYVQNINVTVSDQETDLVTVSTSLGRPIPNVIINDTYETNNSGSAIVQDEGELVLEYIDDSRQGVDINDLILLYDHILGKVVLNKYQLLASDFSADNIVSTLDHVLLQKFILGIETSEVQGWDFVKEDNGSNVKGNYIGLKYGDLDDSSILNYDEEGLEKKSLIFKDLLVNAGEEYNLDVRSSEAVEFVGAQLIYEIPETVSILDVTFPNSSNGFFWFIDENKNLRIIYFNESNLESIEQDAVLFKVKFSSSENGVGADIFKLYDKEQSLFVTEERENIVIDGKVENEITSGNKDVVIIKKLRVRPNPAISYINIDLEKGADFQVNVLNANGQKQMTSNSTKVDISSLGSGLYFIQGINDSKLFSSKFIKL